MRLMNTTTIPIPPPMVARRLTAAVLVSEARSARVYCVRISAMPSSGMPRLSRVSWTMRSSGSPASSSWDRVST